MAREDRAFYVSNKTLYQAYKDWYAAIEIAEAEGKDEPQMPPEVIDAIIKICNKLAWRPNFIGYSYRDEMICDAILRCVEKAKKFDLGYNNPFSYITTLAWNVFIHKIDQEKTQTYVKAAIASCSPIHEFIEQADGDEEYIGNMVTLLQEVDIMDNNMPMSLKRVKKEKEQVGALDSFFE